MNNRILSVLEKISTDFSNDATIQNQSELLSKIEVAREQILQDSGLPNNHASFFTHPSINLEPILNLIHFLQDNIDQNDYLHRHHSDIPIADQPIKEDDIPFIYKAVTQLVDLAVDLKRQETPTTDNDAPKRLNELRLRLITNGDNLPKEIEYWTHSYNYNDYPRKDFSKNRKRLDHIEIDRILQKKHYSNMPPEEAIRTVERGESQPSLMTLRTDECIQFNTLTKECFRLNNSYDSSGKHDVLRYSSCYPLKLLSIGITHCHTVLIKDEEGHIWMLHVSPNAVAVSLHGGGMFMPSKPAYSDLFTDYHNDHIKLKGKLEVIIIEKHESSFNETLFRRCLPAKTSIASFKRIDVDPYVSLKYDYSVCFLPDTNELIISGAQVEDSRPVDKSVTIPHIFNPPPGKSDTLTSTNNDTDETPEHKIRYVLNNISADLAGDGTVKNKRKLLNKIAATLEQFNVKHSVFTEILDPILTLLTALQENIDHYDYLHRHNAETPIVDKPIKEKDIPYIYKAVTQLVDLIMELKLQHLGDFVSSCMIYGLLNKSRCQHITQCSELPFDIDHWINEYRYEDYPREHFSKNQKLLDSIEIDRILRKIHYSNIPPETAVRHCDDVYNDIHEPSYIGLTYKGSLEYHPKTGKCFTLNRPLQLTGEYAEQEYSANYPIKLVSHEITDGHTVLIKDEGGHIWMLNVPSSAVTRKRTTYLERTCGIPEKAYGELSLDYKHDDIQLSGKLDIIVIDTPGGVFDQHLLESRLPKNTRIASLKRIEADLYTQHNTYSVCFLPESNELVISGYQQLANWEIVDKVIKLDNVFSPPRLNPGVDSSEHCDVDEQRTLKMTG